MRHTQLHHGGRLLLAGLLFLLLGTSAGATPAMDDPLSKGFWEHLGTKKSIVLKRKRIAGTKLFAVRGETTVNSSIERVASVLCDHTRWIEWTESLSDARLLARGPGGEKIVYQAFDMPAIIADRDVVYAFRIRRHDSYVELTGSTRPNLPSPPSVGVRMNMIQGRWFLRQLDEDRTHLVLEVLMDPKGSLPSWFVNIVQRDYPVDTLAALRRQAAKRDIKPLPPGFIDCGSL